MKISAKLVFAVLVPVLLILVVGATLIISYVTMEAAWDNGNKVRLIRDHINELNHLVFYYVTYREERPKQQFQAEMQKMTALLDGARFRDPDLQRLLNEIRLNSQSMKEAFFRLVSSTEFNPQDEGNELIRELKEEVAGQLLIRSHNADSIASNLKKLVDGDIRRTQTRTLAFTFMVLILTTSPLGYVLIRTRRSITSDLTKLREGTEVVRSGNLDYAIAVERNDEIGELTRAFNRMAADLKKVTASKTDLEKEMAERRKAETELRISQNFLEIANRHTDLGPLLRDFVRALKEFTDCEAVGIRLLRENGDIPYMAYEGFSRKFYETESPLSIKTDRCMCINVVKGTTDPTMPFYTGGGSFYMNGTTRFLATVSEKDKGQTRNFCNQTGYESVALIPIKLGTNLLGLIHLADCQENKVPWEMVKTLEQVASALGIGIQRTLAEEERERLLIAVRGEKDRLTALVNSIQDEVWFADAEKKVTLVNPAVWQEFSSGLGDEKDVEKIAAAFEVYRPDGTPRPVEEAPPLRALRGELVSGQEEIVRTPATGQLRHRQVSAAPVRDPDGAIIGSVSVVRDITERKRGEEALRQRTVELQQLTETLEERVKERTAELENLTSQLVFAQENERERISYELHDQVWQNLVAIRMEIEGLFIGRDDRDWADSQGRAKKVIAEMLETVGKIRSMQGDLWPYVLDDIGLVATLDWYCREFRKKHPGLNVKISHEITEAEILREAKIVIYRILQESLNNVAKHSRAGRVTIRLATRDQGLEFSIEDDGLGFDPEETIARRSLWGGLGLLSIKARTGLSGGVLEVESAKGKGTTVRARWPI